MELRARGIPVFDDISEIGMVPDIIHGNHNVALATAMMRFRNVPCIFVCHDSISPFDKPLISDRIAHYVAVDYACKERLMAHGVPDDRSEIIINAVDTERFKLKVQFSARPKSAVAIIKGFHQDHMKATYIQTITDACAERNIKIDFIGRGVGKEVDDLSSVISHYDVCFAFSRSAMEACCSGAHVIITDEFGYGGVLSAEVAAQWPKDHLSRHIALGSVSVKNLLSGIDAYDATEAKKAALAWRRINDIDSLGGHWEEIYVRCIYEDKIKRKKGKSRYEIYDDKGLCQFVSGLFPRANAELRAVIAQRAMVYQQIFLDYIHVIDKSWKNDLRFSENTLASALMLGEGWSHSESWGTWTCDEVVTFNLPIKLLIHYGQVVAFRCKHYFPALKASPDRAQVNVFIGDKQVKTFYFLKSQSGKSSGQLKKMIIPSEMLDNDNLFVRLRFVIKGARSPAFYGESGDTRRLGLGLIGLSLEHCDSA
jgi:hypothetical protein